MTPPTRANASFKEISFSRDGKNLLLVGNDNNVVYLVDSYSGATKFVYSSPTSTVTTATITPDGGYILAGTKQQGLVHVWNAKNGKLMCDLEDHSSLCAGSVSALAWNPTSFMVQIIPLLTVVRNWR